MFDSDKDGPDEIDQAVRWSVGRWGGRYNPFIPIVSGDIPDSWWNILKITDPDIVFSFRPLSEPLFERILSEILPSKIIETTDADRERFSSGRLVREHDLMAFGVGAIPTRVWEERLPFAEPHFVSIKSTPASGTGERLALHNFGTVEHDMFSDRAFEKLPRTTLEPAKDLGLSLTRALLRDARKVVLPIDLCGKYVQRSYWIGGGAESDAVHVVVGDSSLDLAHTWNRGILSEEVEHGRARDIFWVPAELLNGSDALDALVEWIGVSIRSDRGGTRGFVTTYSLDEDTLAPLVGTLNEKVRARFESRKLTPTDFADLEWRHRYNQKPTETVEVPYGPTEYALKTPRPPFFNDRLRDQGQWMVDVLAGYRPTRQARFTTSRPGWSLPKHRNLPDSFLPGAAGRVTVHGLLAAPVGHDTSDLTLRIPDDDSVVLAWFSSTPPGRYNKGSYEPAPFSLRLSQVGYHVNGIVSVFGSLFHAGMVADDPYWRDVFLELSGKLDDDTRAANVAKVLSELAEGAGGSLQAGSVAIGAAAAELIRRRVLLHGERPEKPYGWFKSRFQRMQGQERKAGRTNLWSDGEKFEEQRREELESYLHDGIIHRGMRVKCEVCGHSGWWSVDSLRETVACESCTAASALPLEQIWAFRLNPLVSDGVAKHGIMAQLYVLQTMETLARGMFLWLPPVDVFDADGKTKVTDLDIVAIRDREFVLGEVKSSPGGFSADDFQKLKKVSTVVRPHRVIAAAIGESWPAEIKTQIDALKQELDALGIVVEEMLLRYPT